MLTSGWKLADWLFQFTLMAMLVIACFAALIGLSAFVVIVVVGGLKDLRRWWDGRRHES